MQRKNELYISIFQALKLIFYKHDSCNAECFLIGLHKKKAAMRCSQVQDFENIFKYHKFFDNSLETAFYF